MANMRCAAEPICSILTLLTRQEEHNPGDLVPAAVSHHSFKIQHDTPKSLASPREKFELGLTETFCKKKGKLIGPLMSRIDSDVRAKLRTEGHTNRELESLRWIGKRAFHIKHEEVKANIKGRWNKEQTGVLLMLWEKRMHSRIIADHLGRDEAVVQRKLAQLERELKERNDIPIYEGPQVLSAALEDSVVQTRLSAIWEALMTFPKTRDWEKALSKAPSEHWLSLIIEHTPKRVRSMLSSHQPPNIPLLKSLDWPDTVATGVYGRILKPKGRPQAMDDECYLYIGSASKYGAGLKAKGRPAKWMSWCRPREKTWLQNKIECYSLNPRGSFILLFEIPFKDDSDEEVERVRRLVALAKAVFTIWLGAVKKVSRSAIPEFIPWELDDIRYNGLGECNPLLRNIKDPEETREKLQELYDEQTKRLARKAEKLARSMGLK